MLAYKPDGLISSAGRRYVLLILDPRVQLGQCRDGDTSLKGMMALGQPGQCRTLTDCQRCDSVSFATRCWGTFC